MPFEARNNYYKFSLSTGVGALHSPVLNVEFDGKFSRLMYYRNVIKEEIGKCESSDAFTERGHVGDISNGAGYIHGTAVNILKRVTFDVLGLSALWQRILTFF